LIIIRTFMLWFGIIIYTAIAFSLLAIMEFFMWLMKYSHPQRVAHKVAEMWARAFFVFTPGWKLIKTGLENLPPKDEPVVYISNHQSMSDIWAMYSLRRQFRWIAKDMIFKLPAIGQSMKWAGYIPIKRGSRQSMEIAMASAHRVLKGGDSMFFFPEGTRSENDELLPFKIGAFKLAGEANVRVVPLTLDGAGRLIRKGSPIASSSTVRVHVDLPIEKFPEETLEQFAARARTIISQNLAKLRMQVQS
jgi:1-acyl-sn-glycerol-3-phosphate acyltransferase